MLRNNERLTQWRNTLVVNLADCFVLKADWLEAVNVIGSLKIQNNGFLSWTCVLGDYFNGRGLHFFH